MTLASALSISDGNRPTCRSKLAYAFSAFLASLAAASIATLALVAASLFWLQLKLKMS